MTCWGPPKAGLGIDHPILTKERPEERREVFWFRQELDGSGAGQQFLAISVPKSVDELSTKNFGESFDGQEEGVFGVNPPFSVRTDSSTRNDAVNMRMKEQVLTPCMKDAEETNLRPEMFGIAGHLAECFSNGAKQQAVEFGRILQNERV
jgi:hypothetical protein